MNLYEKVSKLQAELKCNKSQYNSFGKYNYRSCEDITEAIKPYLTQLGLVLIMNDEVVFIEGPNYVISEGEKKSNGRFYIKSTATLINTEDGEKISSTAYAREEDAKKGMDASQVTGAASSYSRKYALNALLCLDDTKDADASNTHSKESTTPNIQSRPQQRPTNNQTSSRNSTSANISITLEEATNTIMPAGKFAGKTLGEILAENKGYITFVANTSKDAKLKAAAIKLLEE